MRIRKQHDVRLNEILSCAETLFTTKGYEQTTINDILKAVDIGKGTFYHYFTSKEEVMDAVIANILKRYSEAAKQTLADTSMNALEKFARITLGTIPEAENTQEIITQLHLPGNAAFHQKSLTETILVLSPLLAEVVRQGIDEGTFHTPYPQETVEILLTANQFLFDLAIFNWTPEEMLPRVQAFVYSMEVLLGTKKGSFDFVIDAYTGGNHVK